MIFGQSAGAASVSLHATLPASWPYFAKAAMSSGAFATWNAGVLGIQPQLDTKQTSCGSALGSNCR